tara:strand:+ start:572 stop:811 length:240 start_codon:yes stop_codon:yes gene_type:complete
MRTDMAALWGVMVIIMAVGSLVIAKYYEKAKKEEAEAEEFWRVLQMNLYNGNVKGHTFPDDHIIDPYDDLPPDNEWSKR